MSKINSEESKETNLAVEKVTKLTRKVILSYFCFIIQICLHISKDADDKRKKY